MNLTKKQIFANMLIGGGCVISLQCASTQVIGPATRSLKIFGGLLGAGSCLAGLALLIPANTHKPPGKK